MDFNKVITNMQELQSKIKVYELKNKNIDEAINSIKKEINKLEKKREKEQNEIEKNVLNIKILIMKEIVKKFNFKN